MSSTAKTCPSEEWEQAQLISWWRKQGNPIIFHIPNGGNRGMNEARRLKTMGVTPGVPDLYCPEWRLWVEMKRQKGGSLSPSQKEMIAYLEGIGDRVIVAKGFEDAVAQLGYRTDGAKG